MPGKGLECRSGKVILNPELVEESKDGSDITAPLHDQLVSVRAVQMLSERENYQPKIHAKMSGATIVASLSTMNLGV